MAVYEALVFLTIDVLMIRITKYLFNWSKIGAFLDILDFKCKFLFMGSVAFINTQVDLYKINEEIQLCITRTSNVIKYQ